jgi:predicted nucleotidyltransferase
MSNQQIVLNKVKSYVQDIINSGVPIEKVYLFGSFAKGNYDDNSDIDVALISEVFSGFSYEDRSLISNVSINNEYIDIEAVTFSKETYLISNPFLNEIIETGIEIELN